MSDMFCFQCEQTAGGKGCTKIGVCGKKAATAGLQDVLIGELASLAACDARTPEIDELVENALFSTLTNVNFDDLSLSALVEKVRKARVQAGGAEAYDLARLWQAQEDVRSLKSLLLFGMKGIAAYASHARALGRVSDEVTGFLYRGLVLIASDAAKEELLAAVMEAGRINLVCMELLHEANRTYGIPSPVEVSRTVEEGPFIIVTGHDLHDMALLLAQTENTGVNVYTHGEMLPAHAYPELKKYAHFKGHFGTAWQNQQKEFAHVPAPVLFTTNCIMPVKETYADRVFTTGVVQYPGMRHIDGGKDFSPVIEKALELGGYAEAVTLPGINGGTAMTTGFGSEAVLSHAGTIVEAVKSGAIRHFFLVGGCDGLAGWFSAHGMQMQHQLLGELWKNWEIVMGPDIAPLAHPLGHRGAILLIGGEDSCAMQELSYAVPEILERVNAFMDEEYFQKVELHLLMGRESLRRVDITKAPSLPPPPRPPKLGALKLPPDSPLAACYEAYVRLFDGDKDKGQDE